MTRNSSFPVVFLLLAVCCAVGHAAEDSWKGKVVFPKHTDVHFTRSEQGKEVDLGALNWPWYNVLADNGKAVRVTQDNKEGWVAKRDVVLFEDAIAFFTQHLRQNPRDAFALIQRGYIYLQKGEWDPSIKDLDEVIRLRPRFLSYAHYCRGAARYGKKEVDLALKDYDESIHLDPKAYYAYKDRGVIWHARGDRDRAIKDFTESIQLFPGDAEVYNYRGWCYFEKMENDRALKDLDEALRLSPVFPLAQTNRGVVYFTTKQYARAVKDYEEALRGEPKFAEAHARLAWLMATCPKAEHRDAKKAVTHGRKACELTEFKDPGYLDALAAAEAEDGRFAEAMVWETKALQFPDWTKQEGEGARRRLKLYQEHKPYRDQ